MHAFQALVGNDPDFAIRLTGFQETEPAAQRLVGVTAPMIQYMKIAFTHARCDFMRPFLSAAQHEQVLRCQLAHRDDWAPLIARVRALMNLGTRAGSPSARALGAEWAQLFRDSHGGNDPDLADRVREAYRRDPRLSFGIGVDAALLQFIHAAIEPAGEEIQASSTRGVVNE